MLPSRIQKSEDGRYSRGKCYRQEPKNCKMKGIFQVNTTARNSKVKYQRYFTVDISEIGFS